MFYTPTLTLIMAWKVRFELRILNKMWDTGDTRYPSLSTPSPIQQRGFIGTYCGHPSQLMKLHSHYSQVGTSKHREARGGASHPMQRAFMWSLQRQEIIIFRISQEQHWAEDKRSQGQEKDNILSWCQQVISTTSPTLAFFYPDGQQQQTAGKREQPCTLPLQERCLPIKAKLSTQPRRVG